VFTRALITFCGLGPALACTGWWARASEVPPVAAELSPEPAPARRPNLLVIVADDLGTDKVAFMGEHATAPPTPNLDALAASGVWFRNAYTYPTCSAARTSLLSGRYGRRNGMGGIVEIDSSTWEAPLGEVLLPEVLDRAGDYASAAVGKWHLSGHQTPTGFRHPLAQGFDHFRGSIGNLVLTSRDYGRRGDFYTWEKVVDGVPSWHEGYATVDTTDEALDLAATLPEPWFLWVGYNAPHLPVQPPPDPLRADPNAKGQRQEYDNVVRALDAEIGRLLAGLGPEARADTTIVFVSDNGTEGDFVDAPRDPRRAKGTVFEGGTNVPWIVAGAGVTATGESAALVHAVDLLPTLVELAGGSTEGLVLDGVSFADSLREPASPGHRRFVYTERFAPIGPGPYEVEQAAVRDERYKLVLTAKGRLQLYDLQGRHDDGPFVPYDRARGELAARGAALRAELERVHREVVFGYGDTRRGEVP
jgi:arylsulfatase B